MTGKLVLEIAHPILVAPPPLVRSRICTLITNDTNMSVYMLPECLCRTGPQHRFEGLPQVLVDDSAAL